MLLGPRIVFEIFTQHSAHFTAATDAEIEDQFFDRKEIPKAPNGNVAQNAQSFTYLNGDKKPRRRPPIHIQTRVPPHPRVVHILRTEWSACRRNHRLHLRRRT